MALKITMFSDFICPFCFIGFETIRKLKSEFGFELEWRGFQIHPEWPAEGMPASEYRRGMDPETRRGDGECGRLLDDAAGDTQQLAPRTRGG